MNLASGISFFLFCLFFNQTTYKLPVIPHGASEYTLEQFVFSVLFGILNILCQLKIRTIMPRYSFTEQSFPLTSFPSSNLADLRI